MVIILASHDLDAALEALDRVTEKWEDDYPNAMKRWYKNWDVICPIFKFSSDVRKVIYTTNAIESLRQQSWLSMLYRIVLVYLLMKKLLILFKSKYDL